MCQDKDCLLYTSDAADEEDSVDLGGRRIIKKKMEKMVLIITQKLKQKKNLYFLLLKMDMAKEQPIMILE